LITYDHGIDTPVLPFTTTEGYFVLSLESDKLELRSDAGSEFELTR